MISGYCFLKRMIFQTIKMSFNFCQKICIYSKGLRWLETVFLGPIPPKSKRNKLIFKPLNRFFRTFKNLEINRSFIRPFNFKIIDIFSGGSRGGVRCPGPPLFFEGRKKYFWRPPPPLLSQGLDDRPPSLSEGLDLPLIL